MSKSSLTDQIAREAADRVNAAHQAGHQLELMPDLSAPVADPEAEGGQGGNTRGRGQDKALSQMRAWLTHKGYRMPEDVLAEMAGLTSNTDAVLTAMARTEQLLGWAAHGASQTRYDPGKGQHVAVTDAEGNPLPFEFDPKSRLAAFERVFAMQLKAAEAAMPYVAAKRNPDTPPLVPVQIVMPPAEGQARPAPQVIEGEQTLRAAPPPLPHEMQQNQELSESEDLKTRSEARSE